MRLNFKTLKGCSEDLGVIITDNRHRMLNRQILTGLFVKRSMRLIEL